MTSERLQFILESIGGDRLVNDVQRVGNEGTAAQNRLQAAAKQTDSALSATGQTGSRTGALIASGASQGTTAVGRMSERLGVTESTLRTGIGAAAAIGFGTVVAKVQDAVDSYVDLAGEVRNFQRASGASATESSRFVAVLDDLQISSEAGSAALGKLARADPAKLSQYGIEVAKARDGTVSLTETLLNAADAYAATDDPQQRALLGNAAFGKSYQTLIPLLEQGREGLQDYFAGVNAGQIYTQEALDQARQYELALDAAQDAMAEFGQAAGSTLVPAFTGVLTAGSDALGFIQSIPGPLASGGASAAAFAVGGLALNRVLGQLAEREGGVGRLAGTMSNFGRFGTVGLAIGTAIPLVDLLKAGIMELIGTNVEVDVDRLATALQHLGETGSSGGAFADLGGIKGFQQALDALNEQGDLESSGLIDDLDGLTSIDFSDANDQIAGMDQALAQLVSSGRGREAAASVKMLEEAALEAGYTVDDVRALLPGYAGALEDVDIAQQDAASSGGGLADAAEQVAEKTDYAEEATNRLREAFDQLNGKATTLGEAELAAADGLAAFSDRVGEAIETGAANAVSLDRQTQGARDNEAALIDQIRTAGELAEATANATGSTEAGRQAFIDQIGAIRDNMVALGFNKDQVNALIDRYGQVPSTVTTNTVIRDQVSGQLVSIRNSMDALDGKTSTVTVKQRFEISRVENIPLSRFDGRDGSQRATGGSVAAGEKYRVGGWRGTRCLLVTGGTIVPNTGPTRGGGGGGGDRSGPLVNVQTMVVRDSTDAELIAQRIERLARTQSRAS